MYSRKYHNGRIEVRKASQMEIENGYYSEREWVWTANSQKGHRGGVTYSKLDGINRAKIGIRNMEELA